MSMQEVAYRATGSFKKKLDNYTKTGFLPNGKINQYPKPILYLPEIPDPIELGEYSIFGNKLIVNDTINWHLDIMNKKEFPMDFSFNIDTRTGKNGNVKVIWEINRLQFLSAICLKYHQSQDHLPQTKGYLVSFPYFLTFLPIFRWLFYFDLYEV